MRLLEEHRAVGVPSHCSGLISLRTLREAEIGEEAAIHRITGAFVHTQSGNSASLGGEKTQAVAIDRVKWDQTLAEQAQQAGAELVRARMTSVERENSHVKLHVATDGRDSTMTARMVVGADGTHSRVARTLGMPRPAEFAYNLGIEGGSRRARAPSGATISCTCSSGVTSRRAGSAGSSPPATASCASASAPAGL